MAGEPRWKAEPVEKPRYRMPAMSKKRRQADAVYARNRRIALSGAVCARCGKPARITHHILPRSRGGGHEVENLLPLCDGPSGSSCHRWIHAHPLEAAERGWLRTRHLVDGSQA